MDFAAARKVMVDSQVRVNDVTDRALQAALLAVPRERFLPSERAYAAYAEIEPEIAGGRKLMLARLGLTTTAQESDAAVLEVVGPVLAEEGVQAVTAPLTTPADGLYDVIVCEGAVPGRPEAWLAALNPGGRLAVVERTGPVGKAVLYVRGEQGVSRRELFNAAPPILAELSPEPSFAL